MSRREELLTSCECCEGIDRLTPVVHFNRPGLPALAFRVGTHGRFKTTMLAEIARLVSLGRLGTREDDDLTISIIDAWAVVLDVLTFYQERMANEAFLRTATERRSLLELARLIGYQLGPGVAAGVLLAFILDDAPGSPDEVTVPTGTRAQSLPAGQDELPQSFETSDDLAAEARWNLIHPHQYSDQKFTIDTKAFFFEGVATGLGVGDPLLLVTGSGAGEQALLRVQTVEAIAGENRTLVRCIDDDEIPIPRVVTDPMLATLGGGGTGGIFADGLLDSMLAGGTYVSSGEIMVAAEMENLAVTDLIAHIEAVYRFPASVSSTGSDVARGIYALRVTTAPFGHNAPYAGTLPSEWFPANGSSDTPFAADWDAGDWPITWSAVTGTTTGAIHLERAIPDVVKNSWVVLESQDGDPGFYSAFDVSQESVADFGLSGKTTRLHLANPGATTELADYDPVDNFSLRNTAIHAASERLPLAALPIEELPAGSEQLILEEIVPNLEPGRRLILVGERLDQPGVEAREELEIDRVEQSAYTVIYLVTGLEHGYDLQTVEIYANVAPATHGETRAEVLGSADAGRPFQSFALKGSPLTHVSAPVPSGAESTLRIDVDGVRWHQQPNFYPLGPTDRGYVVRIDNDGKPSVQFGDGVRGERPATGAENIVAGYRVGIGTPGLVAADSITLLANRPLGVKEVINPIPSSGAQDPETRDGARDNAPLTVLTLDRVVSLRDFEDFARAFNGIAKARSDWVWDGSQRVIHVTVSGPDGVEPSTEVVGNLIDAMNGARDPFRPMRISPFEKLTFQVEARVKIDPDHHWETVEASARQAIESAFGFDVRDFAQRVARSDVVAVIQNVPGVVAVDLDGLTEVTGSVTADDFGLSSRPARWDDVGEEILAAQLLLLGSPVTEPIQLTEMP